MAFQMRPGDKVLRDAKRRVYIVICFKIVLLCMMCYFAAKAGTHIRKVGLKPTLQRIWEGPK